VGRAEIVAHIRAAIRELPTHQREVLVLHDLEERPDSEVAALLGIPRNTVKSRLRRGRRALRERVVDLDSPETLSEEVG
jgi:RNA polymerase sigma-70 factor (ECF subfamily)